MKRNEVTMEALVNLGYVAKIRTRTNATNDQCGHDKFRKARNHERKCIFEAIIKACRDGAPVKIIEIPALGETHVYVQSLIQNNDNGDTVISYLAKPTPGAEKHKGYVLFPVGHDFPNGLKDATQFQRLTGWNMAWGVTMYSSDIDTWVIYRNKNDLPRYLAKSANNFKFMFKK